VLLDKRHLLSQDTDRIDKLTTQLSFRLHEGNGRAQYRIGVEDGGSLSCLRYVILRLMLIFRMYHISSRFSVNVLLFRSYSVAYTCTCIGSAWCADDSYWWLVLIVSYSPFLSHISLLTVD